MKLRTGTIWLLLVVFLASGCGVLGGGSSDQATLDQLKDAGSDMSKPHPFDFYLYHTERVGAEQLCAALGAEGFQTRLNESAAGNEWLCLASHTMLPTIDNLTDLNDRFNQLIDQYGGEYDGWETMVIP